MQRFELQNVVAEIKRRHGLSTQLQVALYLGVTEKTVANWLHGRNIPDDAATVHLAQAAGLCEHALLAYTAARRSPTAEGRAAWLATVRRILKTENSSDCGCGGISNGDSDLGPMGAI